MEISGKNVIEAWQNGARQILQHGEIFNLITHVHEPTVLDLEWFKQYNPKSICRNIPTLSEVSTTIFPHKIRGRGLTEQELYRRYARVHDRAKRIHKRTKRSWGTYFDRMIRFGVGRLNQLELIIEAMKGWTKNHKAALVIHISSSETDSIKRTLGSPCLQYIEFLCPTFDTITLLAVYRNHDFFGRVLGNFIGLGQLLKFVCEETERAPGELVCHSAHAYAQSTKTQLKNLAKI